MRGPAAGAYLILRSRRVVETVSCVQSRQTLDLGVPVTGNQRPHLRRSRAGAVHSIKNRHWGSIDHVVTAPRPDAQDCRKSGMICGVPGRAACRIRHCRSLNPGVLDHGRWSEFRYNSASDGASDRDCSGRHQPGGMRFDLSQPNAKFGTAREATGSYPRSARHSYYSWTSAFIGLHVLGVFGISLDVFQIVGGIIIAYMGFDMLGGGQKIAQAPPSSATGADVQNSLAPLVMFAAGPGTITAVVTLAAVHTPDGLPLSALAASVVGAGVTLGVLLLVNQLGSHVSHNAQAIVTRFMGLIVTAMGMQFVLTGYKAFMHL